MVRVEVLRNHNGGGNTKLRSFQALAVPASGSSAPRVEPVVVSSRADKLAEVMRESGA